MKLKLYFFSIFISFVSFGLSAQTTFQSAFQFGNKLNEYIFLGIGVVGTKDGGFVAAYSANTVRGGENFLVIIKTNACQNILWAKKISGDKSSEEVSLSATNDGGFVLAYLYGGNNNDSAYIVATKLDSNCNEIWSRRIRIPVFWTSRFFTISSTTDNGIVLISVADSSLVNFALFAVKFDQTGKIDWKNNLYSTSFALAFTPWKILENSSKDCYLILNRGVDNRIGTTSIESPFIIKVDSNGVLKWAKAVNDNLNLTGATIDNKENIYLVGNKVLPDHVTYAGAFLYKIDKNGNSVFGSTYTDTFSNIFMDVKISANGNIHLVSQPTAINFTGSVLSEMDATGKVIKSDNYQIPHSHGFSFLDFTTDSGLIAIASNANSALNVLKTVPGKDDNCNKQTINLQKSVSNFTTSNFAITSTPGYYVSDTSIDILPFPNVSETFLCSNTFFPHANIKPDTTLCSGTSYTLYKGAQNAGCKTLWSTADTTDSIMITKTGKYWLSVSHGFCTSTDTVTIIFRDQIKTGLVKRHSLCPYDSVLLSVKDTIASYYWVTPSKKTVSGRSVMAKDSGNYYLMLNNTKACAAVDTVHIAWYALPKATAGPDTLLCHDQAYTMQGAGGTVYDWIPATYLSSATDPHAKAILPTKQQYILVVSNPHGCRDTSQVLLDVRPSLQIKAHADNATVCYGKAVMLSATAHGGDSLQWAYNWINDVAKTDTVTIRPTQSGWHKIVLSDNCTPVNAMDSVYISVVPPAKAAFLSIPGNPVKSHEPISFLNQSLNASSYLWTFGDTGKSNETSPKYIYTDTGRYKVALLAYGQNNCPNDTAYGYIQVIDGTVAIYIPNAFTPNRDGKNETFSISGTGIRSLSCQIYNRWGELLYSAPSIPSAPSTGSGTQGSNGTVSLSNGSKGWDGTFKGQTVPEGVYIYQLIITDIDGYFHYLSGNVTVLK